MSTLSQFTNSPAIGEFTTGDGLNWAANPTINGKEYLQGNSYKVYSAAYANLIAAYKYYGYISQTSATNTSWNQANYSAGYNSATKMTCTTDGNFSLWTAQKAFSGTSPATTRSGGGTVILTASGYIPIIWDAIAFGNVLIGVYYDSGGSGNYPQPQFSYSTNYGTSWTSPATFINADNGALLAQNGSTSAVALQSYPGMTGGGVYTSTNGTTWTQRSFSADMTVGLTIRVVRAYYSPVISAYVYINGNGSIWTSTDGYTLTSRTAPTGMLTSLSLPFMQSSYSASSATSTLMITSNSSGTKLLKITSGPTFSIIDLSSVNSYLPISYPPVSIVYDGTRFIISNSLGQIFYSTDEGVTWTRDFNIWNSSLVAPVGVSTYNTPLVSLAYVNSQLLAVTYGFGTNAATNYPLILTNRLLQSTPDYFGPAAGNYLRIA